MGLSTQEKPKNHRQVDKPYEHKQKSNGAERQFPNATKTLCRGYQRFVGNLILEIDFSIDFGIVCDIVEA